MRRVKFEQDRSLNKMVLDRRVVVKLLAKLIRDQRGFV